jgi:hypothetical protein
LEEPNEQLDLGLEMLLKRFPKLHCDSFELASCRADGILEIPVLVIGITSAFPPQTKDDGDKYTHQHNYEWRLLSSPITALDTIAGTGCFEVIIVALRTEQTVAPGSARDVAR